jgi:hypothetical protein
LIGLHLSKEESMNTTTLDITPSPRVLRMLGQIDFAPWQCLAELIDNSVDAFLDQQGTASAIANPKVTIGLPSEIELREGRGRLKVRDNGPGMTLQQLEKAIKAGYSGNDPVEKMGLFGMGFNISTARLGRRTEIWTTRADSAEWVGVVIDFDDLEKALTFKAPLTTRRKTSHELETNAHGTEVSINKLEPTRIRTLTWGAGKASTKLRLGKVYGRVMAKLGLSILYDGDSIKSWRHCIWDSTRSVPTAEFGNVPARIEIDEELPPRKFCRTCWVWLGETEAACPNCGESNNLLDRKRRLTGWIGVQRFFDKEHYGIDLIRNGRVVEQMDKSLFSFTKPEGDSDLEYPVDATHWGGRIVGQLDINFVRVSHQKDAFDKLDPEWQHVIERVRGTSPLRPKIAERLGMPRNTSPLARLYAGYKAGHAGLKELVPGDSTGRGINSGDVRDWVSRFEAGEEGFQTDEKWYALVLQAEKARRGGSSGGAAAAGDLPSAVPTPPAGSNRVEEPPSPYPPAGNTQPQFTSDSELSRAYDLDFQSNTVTVMVAARKVTTGSFTQPFQIEATGFNFHFDYNPRHDFFEASLETPLDCLLTDLAQHFLALAAESPRNIPVSIIERKLREKYFPHTLTNVPKAAEAAEALLAELRAHWDEVLPDVAPIDAAVIDPETLALIQRRVLQSELGDNNIVHALIVGGKFAKHVDNRFLVRMVTIWPATVMDGKFFSIPHTRLTDSLRAGSVAMLMNGIEDVRWLAEEGSGSLSKDIAWRLRYARALASMRLVQSWQT